MARVEEGLVILARPSCFPRPCAASEQSSPPTLENDVLGWKACMGLDCGFYLASKLLICRRSGPWVAKTDSGGLFSGGRGSLA